MLASGKLEILPGLHGATAGFAEPLVEEGFPVAQLLS